MYLVTMGTAEVESALVAHPKEEAAVSFPHDVKGQEFMLTSHSTQERKHQKNYTKNLLPGFEKKLVRLLHLI